MNNLGCVMAFEKLCGVEAPELAQYWRVIMSELSRIASHLVWLGTHALDIGALSMSLYCFREREIILDLFEEYCGARLTLNCMRPGGQPFDLPVGWTERCEAFVDDFPSKVDEYEGLLTNNRIWKKRTVGIGLLTKEQALAYGVTGPMLRGSGVDWDLRKARPYEAYGDVDFDVPVYHNGDTYDRYLVRMEEMRQTAEDPRAGARPVRAHGHPPDGLRVGIRHSTSQGDNDDRRGHAAALYLGHQGIQRTGGRSLCRG